jgi:HK97 family phage prohead protease
MKNKKLQYKSIQVGSDIHLKSVGEGGEISGYASVFDVVDCHGDVVTKGAFRHTLENFRRRGSVPKLLWQHDANFPIGLIEDIHEDDYGLFIRSRLLLEVPKAAEIYALLKNEAINGFSIGYRINDSYFSDNVQYLTAIELLEVSIVTFPACELAVVENVKSEMGDDDVLSQVVASQLKSISQKLKNYNERKNSA